MSLHLQQLPSTFCTKLRPQQYLVSHKNDEKNSLTNWESVHGHPEAVEPIRIRVQANRPKGLDPDTGHPTQQ